MWKFHRKSLKIPTGLMFPVIAIIIILLFTRLLQTANVDDWADFITLACKLYLFLENCALITIQKSM